MNLVKVRTSRVYSSDRGECSNDSRCSPTGNENFGRNSETGMLSTSPGSQTESWHADVGLSQSGIKAMSRMSIDHSQLSPKEMYANNYYRTELPASELRLDDDNSAQDYNESSPQSVFTFSAGFNNTQMLSSVIGNNNNNNRRTRSEKKPIPEELKDDRYRERRERNNAAAKKSRDARKAREVKTALRAANLQIDNQFLRAEVVLLRREEASLRDLIFLCESGQNDMSSTRTQVTGR